MSTNIDTSSPINKRYAKLGLLYFSCAIFFFMTMFHSEYWIIITSPMFFFLGAMMRGYNQINGLYEVKELNKVVKK